MNFRAAIGEPGVFEAPAIISSDRVLSFGDLGTLVERRIQDLSSQGVGPGHRITVRATCDVDTVVTFFALLELRAAFVPIHPRLTPAEEKVIEDDVAPYARLIGTNIERLTTKQSAPVDEVDPVVAIVYTSGTTGRPKGAVLTRNAFVASAQASEKNLGWETNDRWLVCMPLAHVGGLSILTRCFAARKPIILEPKFDPVSVLQAIRRESATQISVVPTMLDALLQADLEGDLRRLRFVLVGGAAASPVLLERAAAHGILAITTYGLTEACSQVTCQPLRAKGTMEPGSGKTLPGIELRIVGEDKQVAAANEVGFIQVRGPTIMRGYWNGPDKPVLPARTEDGWFSTGDLGALDESGRLFVYARRTDLIVTGGENVYPAEVELALERCAGVAGAVVFGVPDDRWGQVVSVALVLSPADADDAVRALAAISEAAKSLAPHKRPRRFAVIPTLARNPAGKIDRAGVCREATPLLRIVPTQ